MQTNSEIKGLYSALLFYYKQHTLIIDDGETLFKCGHGRRSVYKQLLLNDKKKPIKLEFNI